MNIDVKEFVKPSKKEVKSKSKDRVGVFIGGAVLLGIVLLVIGLYSVVRRAIDWGNTHQAINQSIVKQMIEFQWPIRIEEIKPKEVLSPLGEAILKSIDDPLSSMQTAVLTKFGSVEFKVVDAIIKCESNYNPEAIHYNSNGTYDAGLFQINQLHWNKEYCPFGLKDLLDANNNMECAYQIYLRNGKSFQAWSSLGNGCVADKL